MMRTKNSHLTLILETGRVHSVFTSMSAVLQVTIGGFSDSEAMKGHDILTGMPHQSSGRT